MTWSQLISKAEVLLRVASRIVEASSTVITMPLSKMAWMLKLSKLRLK